MCCNRKRTAERWARIDGKTVSTHCITVSRYSASPARTRSFYRKLVFLIRYITFTVRDTAARVPLVCHLVSFAVRFYEIAVIVVERDTRLAYIYEYIYISFFFSIPEPLG